MTEVNEIDLTGEVAEMMRFEYLKDLCNEIYRRNVAAGWWTDLTTGEPLKRNVPEMLCLIHSEISEALEGHRRDRMDDKLPHRKMIEVELADAFIRIADTCTGLGYDLAGAVREKMSYNLTRKDHQISERMKDNGKKF